MRKVQKPYNYVYLIHSDVFFYIGCRSCWMPPEQDPYMGSGIGIKRGWFADDKLTKVILSNFSTREEALREESRYLMIFFRHKLFSNLNKGGAGQLHPNERPNSESFNKVQSLVREAERWYLDSFPDEAGTLSVSPLWRELVGLESN